MKKRILSLLMALVMVLSVMTVAAMAKGVQTFADVKESDWFYDAVCYVTDNGLMNGTGSGFAPQQTTSRAMLWAVLSRVDGQNAKRNANDWYAAAQLWAIQHDISDGTAPEAPITREQLAAMLYRYAQRKGLVRAAAYADLSGFADAASVSAYADEAMQWAVANGILTGMDSKLCPQGNATRAQVAQILYRLCETWNLLPADNTAAIVSAIYFAENPEHTHVWGEAKSNGNGTHTSICACGETKTEYCGFPKQTGTVTCPTCGFKTDHGVQNYEDLVQAIQAGEKEIFVTDDIAIEETIEITRGTTIYGVGCTFTFKETDHGLAGKMFRMEEDCGELVLDGVIMDGEGKDSGKDTAVISNCSGGKLTIRNSVLENFVGHQIICSAWYPKTGDVSITNTTIRNNTLASNKASSKYDNETAATLLWFSGGGTFEMKDVVITGNKVTATGSAVGRVGSGYLILMKDGAALNADNVIIADNEAKTLFGTYNENKADTEKGNQRLNSGRIEKNIGHFDVYCDLTIGEGMTIDLGTDVLYFTNSAGVRTLTNNGKIIAKVEQHPWNGGQDAIYTGTGTLDGELSGFTKQ